MPKSFFCELLLTHTFVEMPVLVYGYVLKIRLRGFPDSLNVSVRKEKLGMKLRLLVEQLDKWIYHQMR